MNGVEGGGQGERQALPALAQSLAFRTSSPVRRKLWDNPWPGDQGRASLVADSCAPAASAGGCTTRLGAPAPRVDAVRTELVEGCPVVLSLILPGPCGVA